MSKFSSSKPNDVRFLVCVGDWSGKNKESKPGADRNHQTRASLDLQQGRGSREQRKSGERNQQQQP